jgi:hypothetical protein
MELTCFSSALATIPEYRLDVDFLAYWQIPPAKLA